MQQIKDEIDGQSRPVASCLEQVRQLVLTGGEVLSAPEVSSLESSGRELRSRVDRAQDRTSKLLKKLGSARDELSKLRCVLLFNVSSVGILSLQYYFFLSRTQI